MENDERKCMDCEEYYPPDAYSHDVDICDECYEKNTEADVFSRTEASKDESDIFDQAEASETDAAFDGSRDGGNSDRGKSSNRTFGAFLWELFKVTLVTLVALVIFASLATYFNFPGFFPIGMVLMMVYSWVVIKKIYSDAARGAGTLSLAFVLIALMSAFRTIDLKIAYEKATDADVLISLVEMTIVLRIAALMVLLLVFTYIILRLKSKKQPVPGYERTE